MLIMGARRAGDSWPITAREIKNPRTAEQRPLEDEVRCLLRTSPPSRLGDAPP